MYTMLMVQEAHHTTEYLGLGLSYMLSMGSMTCTYKCMQVLFCRYSTKLGYGWSLPHQELREVRVNTVGVAVHFYH